MVSNCSDLFKCRGWGANAKYLHYQMEWRPLWFTRTSGLSCSTVRTIGFKLSMIGFRRRAHGHWLSTTSYQSNMHHVPTLQPSLQFTMDCQMCTTRPKAKGWKGRRCLDANELEEQVGCQLVTTSFSSWIIRSVFQWNGRPPSHCPTNP
jgi:hypothetical protein